MFGFTCDDGRAKVHTCMVSCTRAINFITQHSVGDFCFQSLPHLLQAHVELHTLLLRTICVLTLTCVCEV